MCVSLLTRAAVSTSSFVQGNVTLYGALWTWAVILVSHYRFHRTLRASDLAKLPRRVPFFPYCNSIAIAFLVVVIALVTCIYFATKGQRAGRVEEADGHAGPPPRVRAVR
ncbi:hypothetical protein [Burkholderia ubonensis]|uniref:Amino acid permease/ SLC12A domain-containing protein n=1 Tax=Burkholderia ubonensis TaxID=101571 RepID=A0A1R1J3A2_9BURK|nr:hypothetical protein [Burkholderia ubonensis]OMG69511.1 hypothetical protein BW685_31615 [Burkholderia ubonensis]